MRVLGVDPGADPVRPRRRRRRPGAPARLVAVGVVRDPGRRRHRRPAASPIERGIEAWLDRHRPDAVAVERVFSQHNVRT